MYDEETHQTWEVLKPCCGAQGPGWGPHDCEGCDSAICGGLGLDAAGARQEHRHLGPCGALLHWACRSPGQHTRHMRGAFTTTKHNQN